MVLAALAAGACARSPAGGADGLRVVPLGGEVRLVHDGDPVLLDEAEDVTQGDVVTTGASGWALVELGVGRSLELAPGAAIRVGGPESAEVIGGSVLARAGEPGLALRAGDAEILGERTVFRVDRDFSVTLAVYQGQADLPGSGVGPVPALRQTTVVAGGTVPRGPQPLIVRPDDPWDAELLGTYIDLGLALVDLQRGLTRQLPPRDGAEAVAAVLGREFPGPAVEAALGDGDIRAAEAVVAAVVSEEAARLAKLPLLDAIEEVLDLRLAGAHWIVVLAQWQVAGSSLVQDLARLSGLIARFVAPPEPGTSGSGGKAGTGGGASGGGTGGSGGSGGGGGSGDTGGTGGDTTTGGGGPPPPPEATCSNPLDCLVDDVVDELENPPLPGLP